MQMKPFRISFKSEQEFSWVPLFFQIRIYAGFVLAILTVILDYGNNTICQALTMLPYIVFTICMVLFYKKRIDFRLWYVLGAILGIGVQYYLASLQVYTIAIEIIMILALFLSPYIKEHYRRKGAIEVDISDV